jgi:hypothetical protein
MHATLDPHTRMHATLKMVGSTRAAVTMEHRMVVAGRVHVHERVLRASRAQIGRDYLVMVLRGIEEAGA